MKKEIADAWIADLRTNPPQTTGVLYDGKGYCCLGRLCVVLGREFDKNYVCEYENRILPNSVIEEAGLGDNEGQLLRGDKMKVGDHFFQSLAHANDDGSTFDEIADAIEKYWKNL